MINRIRTQTAKNTLKCLVILITFSIQSFSQVTNYKCTIKNTTLQDPNNLVFEIWIENTGTNSLMLSGFQAGINFNYSAIANGGTITGSALSGSSGFVVANINPVSKQIRISNYSFGVNVPPAPGIKLGTVVMTNTVAFNLSGTLAFSWTFETSSSSKTNTIIICHVNGDPLSTNITVPGKHFVDQVLEICGNGIDDNFNGIIDEGCSPFIFIATGRPRCSTLQDYSIYVRNGFFINGYVMFEADPQMVYSSSSPAPDSISGNKYFYHFASQQLYFLSKLATLTFYIPGPGNIICSRLKMNPIDNLGNINYNTSYTDNICQPVRCGFDPNEKIVSPPENIPAAPDSWLKYTVFFQNTGNDTAYDISVRDTLDASLDKSTFLVLESSHPYSTSIDANSTVTFSFNNIFLPDSNIDEPGSHGYITYIVKPLPGLPNYAQVHNKAYIYFDANPPILTNTTINIFSDDITLILKTFIEGFYLSDGTMIAAADPVNYPNLCDTITVELHNPSYPYGLAHIVKSTIDINGNGYFTFPSVVKGNSYYLAVHHRNSIETWSTDSILFNQVTRYNFSNSLLKAFGNNMRALGDGKFAIWSGDISDSNLGVGHQDGIIESQDYSDMENAVSTVLQGYIPEDITGDGIVESSDYSLIENNLYAIILSMRP